jgi:carbamoyltransferase
MITVGVSRVHNSSVALLKEGDLLFHLENERLSNIKYDAYPFLALGQLPKYVDYVDNICLAGVSKTPAVECFKSNDAYTTLISQLNKKFFDREKTIIDLWEHHHQLHASCAFYNSGFDQALCIIKDGMGSDFSINDPRFLEGSVGREIGTTFIAEYPARFEMIDKHVMVPFECNTTIDGGKVRVSNNAGEGLAFQQVSMMYGFHALDAGKIMGMSSYGKYDSQIPPIYNDDGLINKELFDIKEKHLHNTYVNYKKFPYLTNEDFQIRANFAFALQRATEQRVKEYILTMVEKTGIKNVCLSGGYFLNCVANYEFLKDLPDDINIYAEPISSDAGTSIGAAKIVWHDFSGDTTIRKQETIYHGLHHHYELKDIKSKLLPDEDIDTVEYSDIAKLISNRNIVAMYQGRSEAGPRALGNRSILYDPRDPTGKDTVNIIKKREWFRPFAGSVLEEKAKEWFDMRCLDQSPFMMYAVDVLPHKQKEIPSITHVDGTCRVQTVNCNQNYHFYNLIKEFYKLTNVPILFNTSFNLAGECIVETLDNALDTLRRSNIEYLYLPEFKILITIKNNE